jgi:hypothetical protein
VGRGFVPHHEFEADRRFRESRQIETHRDPTLGTLPRLRGGGLVHVTSVELMGKPKE